MLQIDYQELFPLGRSMALIAKSYFGALAKRLGKLEEIRYYSILVLIDNEPQARTQHFIGEQLRIDKVSMVRMIEHLVKKGYVEKFQNPADRREYLVALTKKGQKTMPQLYAALEDVNRAATDGLTNAQQQTLLKNLQQIQNNLDVLPFEKVYINYKKASKQS